MSAIILVVHLILALAMIGVVLIQKSEGGGLGMGGGMSGFMTGRSTANLLTRTTAILAAGFMVTSIVLALLAGVQRAPHSIIEQSQPAAPSAPAQPAVPAAPSVPLTK